MSEQATILAVDDTSDSLALLVELLTRHGYSVRAADSGELALASLATVQPDLVLMDVRMGGMDGIEACRRLKARQETRHVPVILMSAFADVKEWVEGLAAGAADFVPKPFQADELLARVRTHLSLRRTAVALDLTTASLLQANQQLQAEIGERRSIEIDLRRSLEQTAQSEEALRARSEEYKALIDGLPDIVTRRDRDGRILFVSANVQETVDMKAEQFIGKTSRELGFPEERCRIEEKAIQTVVDTAAPLEVEFTTMGKDGPIFINSRLIPERDARGAVRSVLSVARDVTAQRRAEAALRRREEQYRTILQTAMDGFWLLDEEGHLLEVNEAYSRISGYGVPELLRMDVLGLVVTETADDAAALAQQIIARGNGRFEAQHRRKDGSVMDVETSVQHQPAGGGRIVVFLRDITERKRLEQQLTRVMAAVESASDAIGISDAQGHHVYQNKASSALFGYATAEEMEAAGGGHAVVKDPAVAAAMFDSILNGGSWVGELEMVTRSGRVFPAHERADAILDSAGKVVGVMGIATDITERKRAEAEKASLEAQLLQSQKMEAVGQLAGGIAHDFNNILAAVIMQLNMLRLQPSVPPDELGQAVDEMLESANRAANLTRQLLLFSRRQAMMTGRHDLNVILRDLAKLLERLIDARVTLVLQLSDEPLWFEGDAGMIEQVVTNLCVNARDAMPSGGRLTIATGPVVFGDETATRHRTPGRHLCLQISDTGHGIESSVLEHIFEPFFTTKEQGKGTGLGLASVYGIVTKHRGFIDVASQVGRGSTFSVYLPSVSAAGAREPRQARVAVKGGSERILVVEDEGAVRRMAVRCLRQLGYRVAEAADAADALTVWERENGEFDLVLTDMAMPGGLSGLELCERLRQSKAGLRAIVASGYSAEIVDAENVSLQQVTFLSKPYDIATLTATVRECLEQNG